VKYTIKNILASEEFTRDSIVFLLQTEGKEKEYLYQSAADIKKKHVGDVVYFRGLIEFSNLCSKDCLYCGIRKSNQSVERYLLTDEEVIAAATFAHKNNYGSIVLQSGERSDNEFINRVDRLIQEIKAQTDGMLGITLSLGEQTETTYQRWFESGAHRYLLRIESSNPELYQKIHPVDHKHIFSERIESLNLLKKIGYQLGTGVMIGLPFQTLENLAEDILFMKNFNIDMVGMGPYIEHKDTPLYQFHDTLWPLKQRFDITLKMIAVLRIMMKDINIAATTALQAIDKIGREKAIKIGANIMMPNITPVKYREGYKLYENKPCLDEEAEDCLSCLETRIYLTGNEIGYGRWGDSKHFKNRNQ
jgi:biotin synthase